MKKLFLLVLLTQFGFQINAQDEMPDFILRGKDTTFCFITRIVRSAGPITKIEYISLDGDEKFEIKKDEIENIKTIRVGGYTMDYIPLKASKPDSYHRHIERKIDGKIIIYDHIRLQAETNKKGERQLTSTVGSGAAIKTIKLGKNNYYDVSKSNIKEYVIPYLNKCKAFQDGFSDEVTSSNIEEAVKFYNEVCK